MRSTAMIYCRQWLHGPLHDVLKRHGHRTALVLCYLHTSPHSHMSGVFLCPISHLSTHTTLSAKDARRELTKLSDDGIIVFDSAVELVWIKQMAFDQVGGGREFSLKDNRVKQIRTYLRALPPTLIIEQFCRYYDFKLSDNWEGV